MAKQRIFSRSFAQSLSSITNPEQINPISASKFVFRSYFKSSFLFPLLFEQHRIVAKVDELFEICDALKEKMESAQVVQLHLADALTGAADLPFRRSKTPKGQVGAGVAVEEPKRVNSRKVATYAAIRVFNR